MAATEQRTEASGSHEDLRIRQWRMDQFYALGFPLSDAKRLALSGADVAQARKIVGAGCPIGLAYRIIR